MTETAKAASLPLLQIIVGSTRPGRMGPSIATWFHRLALTHGGFDVEHIDLAEVALPLLDEPGNPARGGLPTHGHSQRWSATVGRGDAYVFVTPEYNNGYNAATKNAIDYLYSEWADKSVGIVSYGGNVGAGTRAVQALKHVLLAVKAVPVHESVNIPFIYSQIGPDGTFSPGDVLEDAARGMLDEMARRETALKTLRRTPFTSPSASPNPLQTGALTS